MEKKPVNIKSNEANLIKIEYSFNPVELKDSYKVKIFDEVKIENVKENSFDLIYIRKSISNDPFSVVIAFKTNIEILSLKDLAENNETISDFAERKKIDIVNKLTLPARASLLISNITRECGGAFISIPVFIEEKQKA